MGHKAVTSHSTSLSLPTLDAIRTPADLRKLDRNQLVTLAGEIREKLIKGVSQTGGHLGPNLGVVELTIALHLVFDSPRDPIIFDTGHQSYVHKMLTGRADQFNSLRQKDGLSGYPSRSESEHDWVENSHASTALSWAEGLAKGFQLLGQKDRTVAAVVGDGAMTGGMAWEALNNIAVDEDLPLVIVVNDNGRSYLPTVGGLSRELSAFRTDPRYEETLGKLRRKVKGAPLFGQPLYELLHGLKAGIKDVLAPQTMFSDLGIKYLGPIDGHDIEALAIALHQAKGFGRPIIVHVITDKGKGFSAAENHAEDLFHSVGHIDDVTGQLLTKKNGPSWTDIFADEMVNIGKRNDKVVAISAAMINPVGLAKFRELFPDRTFDVGIAEAHAITSAAGLASAGMHPVVALYSTFLNRAFDQVLMDAGLHKCPITLVLDRSGITGTDGPSHNGMWDTGILGMVPGLHYTAPRDAKRLVDALNVAIEIDCGPSVIRYSKDQVPLEIKAIDQVGDIDVLYESAPGQVLVIGYGQFCGLGLEVAKKIQAMGIGVRVVDPVWALPIPEALVRLVAESKFVVSIEDALVTNGLGAQLGQRCASQDIYTPIRSFGIPREFLETGSRAQVLADVGLTAPQILDALAEPLANLC